VHLLTAIIYSINVKKSEKISPNYQRHYAYPQKERHYAEKIVVKTLQKKSHRRKIVTKSLCNLGHSDPYQPSPTTSAAAMLADKIGERPPSSPGKYQTSSFF
jgi:hypothetical protein